MMGAAAARRFAPRRAQALLLALVGLLVFSSPVHAAGAGGIVVWDFDDQTPAALSALSAGRLTYLKRALSENLSNALLDTSGLQVVERQRLRDVMAEQKLGTSELADADTRLRLGRIVGAGRMVFGSFFALGDEVQVNLRVVDTATSRVLFSDEIAAPSDAVMERVGAVNQRLLRSLGGAMSDAHAYPDATWHMYDVALGLSDQGRYDEAVEALQRLLTENKDFTPAERELSVLLEKQSRR